MGRDRVVQVLKENENALRAQGVKSLVLYGPVARNETSLTGDIDFFLEMHPPHTFDRYLKVKDMLHALLGQPVELVMENPHHPAIWPYVQNEAVFIL